MEIERVVIENFIRNAGHAAKHEGLVRVCPHKLLELCRVYVAVLDAPEVELTDCNNPKEPLPHDWRTVTWDNFPTRRVKIVDVATPTTRGPSGE